MYYQDHLYPPGEEGIDFNDPRLAGLRDRIKRFMERHPDGGIVIQHGMTVAEVEELLRQAEEGAG